jgi:hypothetical protein
MNRRQCICTLLLLLASMPALADEAKKDEKKELALAGVWKGSYSYPDGAMPDVDFEAVLLLDGAKLTGLTREANTFGLTDDPWLHATLKGDYDPETRKFSLTKTYDGTSGVMHDVTYTGTFKVDGSGTEAGMWDIGGFGGTFKLTKDATVKPGKLTGLWKGTNDPPKGSEIPKVELSMILFHQGDDIIGFVKEPRASPDGSNPWFHARIKGTFDEKSGEIKFTKTYDGTAKATTEEKYTGKFDDEQLSGQRKVGDNDSGTFTLKRAK